VRVWLDRTIEEAKRAGYVETLLGRRRYLPEIASSNRSVAQFAERMAINTPVQGTAADMIKQAMLAIDRELEKETGTDLFSPRKNKSVPVSRPLMVLQIHDELLFEVPEGEAEALVAMVREKMEGVMKLAVPVKVDVGTGKNWAEAH